ncbi:MFS transporter [Streptomyces sp. DSM 44917]|uniref:MFS transporter n=1 Tax=Streptomyces boetiae TaxID=3075541 RepID=A0ABU2LCT8_9ACTN|nr:MFS transporter [Streptomyces sp. DSM 44917]MDT0309394.1 MFS transporter [Streptomyces sp. DSM 44917]
MSEELTRPPEEDAPATAPPAPQPRGLGRPFWTLWSATTLTNLGQGATGIAFPWLATTLTSDPVLVALAAAAQRLPWLLFSLPAGVLADRLDRRRVMVAMSAARAAAVGLVGLLVALDALTLPLLLACALLLGFGEVLFDNTSQVLLPSVVPRDRLTRANGRLMSTMIVTEDFLARPLGGALTGLALAAPFFFDAGAAALALVALLLLPGSYRAAAPGGAGAAGVRSMRREIAEGLGWLWRHTVLRRLALTLGAVTGALSAAQAVYVLYAQEVLGLGPVAFAVLASAGGLGALLGGFLAAPVSRRLGPSGVLSAVLAVDVVVYAIAGLASHAVLVGAAMSVSGFGVVLWNVVTVSLRQTVIPDHLLGRVNGAYRLLGWGAIPLGMAAGGALAALTEPLWGREASLRVPLLVAAASLALTALFVRRRLSPRILRETLGETP